MKNKFKFSKYVSFVLLVVISITSCTKLNETLYGSKSPGTTSNGVGVPGPISGVYSGLNQLVTQSNWYALEEHSTDELLGPTRGTDWDDFGTWRKLHLHTWDGSHNQINDTWNGLNGSLYQATLVAETASGQTKAEAQFLRAYFMYLICDLYGQVPYVPATALTTDPGTVLSRSDAVDFMITDLDAAIAALPSFTVATRNKATKEAAQYLEAKIYLNKAVFKQDP
ncbi:MAG: RagB/SusD family nutrient uptake outer membrane protein, partial [Bacteroidetes bacterium]|nr:RagB/SusD family nutrient uptake outer membrane protein [Bacteroidota bacterium]